MQNMMGFPQNGLVGMGGMNGSFVNGMSGMSGMDAANGGPGHGTGPVRRGGGGRYGNRSGPYDRGNRNTNRGYGNMGTMMRNGGGGGMNMGYIAQGGGGGGGKWGDGAGGSINAIGPREAVQGRSIRSYEDLDAQPSGGGAATGSSGGGAELDY